MDFGWGDENKSTKKTKKEQFMRKGKKEYDVL